MQFKIYLDQARSKEIGFECLRIAFNRFFNSQATQTQFAQPSYLKYSMKRMHSSNGNNYYATYTTAKCSIIVVSITF